jgi:ribonucleoside-diphosphate reductase alpha chain
MVKIDKKITAYEVIKENKIEFQQHHAPKRPKQLECTINHVKIKGENWVVLVGLFDNKPYEVFCGEAKFLEIPKKHKKGILIKNGKKDGISTYNLRIGQDDDELLIKDVVSVFDNKLHGSMSRLVSLSLRHGVPLEFVCDQLTKDKNTDITSFSSAISRVLKQYIQENAIPTAKCPDCGANLIFEAGCAKCSQVCGFLKCG